MNYFSLEWVVVFARVGVQIIMSQEAFEASSTFGFVWEGIVKTRVTPFFVVGMRAMYRVNEIDYGLLISFFARCIALSILIVKLTVLTFRRSMHFGLRCSCKLNKRSKHLGGVLDERL